MITLTSVSRAALLCFTAIAISSHCNARAAGSANKLDRKALVTRHNVVRIINSTKSPIQVGNGEFAIGADITGLQTFVPFNTMSHWGWHAFPFPAGSNPEAFTGVPLQTHGHSITYPIPNETQPSLSHWLYANPHRFNLGRIGFRILKSNGTTASLDDLTKTRQELNLWTGILKSHFELEGQTVDVETCCHPTFDQVAVRVRSALVASGRMSIFVDFPYDDRNEFADYVGDWGQPVSHTTTVTAQDAGHVDLLRQMDADQYHVRLAWSAGSKLQMPSTDNGSSPIQVLKAEWGAGNKNTDVTALIRKLNSGSKLPARVDVGLLGDPAPGQGKRLKLTYENGVKQQVVEVPENGELRLQPQSSKHRFTVIPGPTDTADFTCTFSSAPLPASTPSTLQSLAASARHWPEFWKSGGAVDLSESKDPRWKELERRIVLSQYLLAINEAGSLPPQESGLVNNGWNGKFHMEMYWWHAAHYALWNRWPLLERSVGYYQKILPQALAFAKSQGYNGARWPKCTTADGREAPHIIHALLIWQQPHPLFFAELDYQSHPTRATLEKWKQIVSSTADFLASYAYWDVQSAHYILGPPLAPVSENTDFFKTQNPTFELGYWRFGLRIAQQWSKRLGDSPNPEWGKVLNGLAPLPVQDDKYVLHEGITDMWTKWNFEHPALIGVYGWLPGDGVDMPTMRRTADAVFSAWTLGRTWGWDFPMMAMCAARLGEPEKAIDLLLTDAAGFQFDDCGLATGGPFPYFPSNGGLLYAVALMAAGWDGSQNKPAPGFPDNGKWKVRYEGLHRAL